LKKTLFFCWKKMADVGIVEEHKVPHGGLKRTVLGEGSVFWPQGRRIASFVERFFSFFSLLSSPLPFSTEFARGYVSGGLGLSVGFPLETIKIQQQAAQRPLAFSTALKGVIKSRGVMSL
jgi:hypothetical protein